MFELVTTVRHRQLIVVETYTGRALQAGNPGSSMTERRWYCLYCIVLYFNVTNAHNIGAIQKICHAFFDQI